MEVFARPKDGSNLANVDGRSVKANYVCLLGTRYVCEDACVVSMQVGMEAVTEASVWARFDIALKPSIL